MKQIFDTVNWKREEKRENKKERERERENLAVEKNEATKSIEQS